MTDSILTTIKKMLGISEEYEHFDIDIITHINSTFSILAQLGVGPDKGFSIHDLSLIHISEPTRRTPISYAVFCLKKKNKKKKKKKK